MLAEKGSYCIKLTVADSSWGFLILGNSASRRNTSENRDKHLKVSRLSHLRNKREKQPVASLK